MLQQRLSAHTFPEVREFLELHSTYGIIGRSKSMNEVFHQIATAAYAHAPVLVLGESGTGKELVAKAVHKLFGENTPFVAVNSSAVPGQLVESELFGYERGAFTGADRKYKGKFQQANGGVLFLDEIGEMDIPQQAKLLRAVEYGQISPLGSESTVTVNLKLVAATNIDLEEAVRKGKFREDLFYRLSVIPITIPALTERDGDIRLLARYFLMVRAHEYDKPCLSFNETGYRYLESQKWYGNVRELDHFIHRVVLTSENVKQFGSEFLSRVPKDRLEAKRTGSLDEVVDIDKLIKQIERGRLPGLMDTLDLIRDSAIDTAIKNVGQKDRAGKMLGISPRVVSYYTTPRPDKPNLNDDPSSRIM